MKLVIPYIDELNDLDVRMVRLAEFLGVPCRTIALEDLTAHAEYVGRSVPEDGSCLVVNPHVLKEWVGDKGIPAELVSFVLSRFTRILVHGLRVDAFDSELVAALSRGRLKSVEAIDGERLDYVIAKDAQHICEAFSGLSFGPANSVNDHVFFCTNDDNPAMQRLISIGGRPFMVSVRLEGSEILFVASEDVADLNAEVGDSPLAEYFSRFVPHTMALRYAAGDECWRPCKAQASIVLDDPLLRKNYGFLNFEYLLRLAEEHNFHAAIAFIPHNFQRSSPRIARMFRKNTAHLSICFHGNDHTEGEFASTDLTLLNTLLQVAEDRMALHYQMTGVACDRVMVFPQGNFSIEAMKVLKFHNFDAAVNTVPHPADKVVRLTIGELAQPAVLRYGGFPLFVRKPIRQTQSHDIAYNLLFGRPILIVEHHDIFQHPDSLVEIAVRINSVAPKAHWCSLATVAGDAILARIAPDGTHQIRAYSGTVRISNDSDSIKRYSIEWGDPCEVDSIDQILMDGVPCYGIEIEDARIRLSVELAPHSQRTFFLVRRNDHAIVRSLGLRWSIQAFLRRRLSEFRDNYLSRNRSLLAFAKAFQRRFLKV